MPIQTDTLNRGLYDLLTVRYDDVTPLDSKEDTTAPEEADIFKFTFEKDGKAYGTVYVTIDNSRNLVLYYGDEVQDSPDTNTSGTEFSDSWSSVRNMLKQWSQDKQLAFELKNKNHLAKDMAQRTYNKEKENLGESYYPMGKRGSYSDAVPNVKIIIQHTRQIGEGEQRYRNIDKIFVENTMGERFAVPSNKPGIAKVYARHIAEGGSPYDNRGRHITSLVEEYTKMAGFVRATKNKQFNESTNMLIQEGVNHYQALRETLSRMIGRRGYNAYFESWQPILSEEITEEVSLNELFVQETIDPRIESVMPILSKLYKKVSEMKEINQLEEWADSIINEYAENDNIGYIQLLQSKLKAGKPLTSQEKEKLRAYLAAMNLGLKEGETSSNPMGIPEGVADGAPTDDKGIWNKYGHYTKQDLMNEFPGIDPKQAQTIVNYAEYGWSHHSDKAKYQNEVISRVKRLLDQQGVAEGGEKDRQWSNQDMERLRVATREFDDLLSGGRPDRTKQDLTKKRIQTKPMAGPKGVLPEQGVAEGKFFNSDYIFAKNGEHWNKTIEGGSGTKQDPYTAKFNEPLRVLAVLMRSLALQMDGKDPKDSSQFGPTPNKLYYKHNNQLYMGDGTNKIMPVENTDHKGMAEDLDANQKRVGQLGPYEKVGPQGAVGKLVGGESIREGQEDLDTIRRLLGEGVAGELVGGALGGIAGNLAGDALGGPIGGIVGGAVGSTAGGMAGRELTKEDQLNEFAFLAPALAAGARTLLPLLSRVGPALGRMASTAGKAGAQVAGKAATGIGKGALELGKSAAQSTAQNAGKVGLGAGIYSMADEIGKSIPQGLNKVYTDATSAASALTTILGNAVDGKTIGDLAAAAAKYAIPLGMLLAVLYGGKKLIDQVMSEGEDVSSMGSIGKTFEGQEDLDTIKRLLGK
jgi:hypothetical protein